jgi:hypothetical protein
MNMLCSTIVVVMIMIVGCDSVRLRDQLTPSEKQLAIFPDEDESNGCAGVFGPALNAIFERVCQVCHNAYGDRMPDLRLYCK